MIIFIGVTASIIVVTIKIATVIHTGSQIGGCYFGVRPWIHWWSRRRRLFWYCYCIVVAWLVGRGGNGRDPSTNLIVITMYFRWCRGIQERRRGVSRTLL